MTKQDDGGQGMVYAPVAPELLERLDGIKRERQYLAEKLLVLEQDRVKIVRVANDLEAITRQIFNGILRDRGLPSDALVNVSVDGTIEVVDFGSGEPPQEESDPPRGTKDPRRHLPVVKA